MASIFNHKLAQEDAKLNQSMTLRGDYLSDDAAAFRELQLSKKKSSARRSESRSRAKKKKKKSKKTHHKTHHSPHRRDKSSKSSKKLPRASSALHMNAREHRMTSRGAHGVSLSRGGVTSNSLTAFDLGLESDSLCPVSRSSHTYYDGECMMCGEREPEQEFEASAGRGAFHMSIKEYGSCAISEAVCLKSMNRQHDMFDGKCVFCGVVPAGASMGGSQSMRNVTAFGNIVREGKIAAATDDNVLLSRRSLNSNSLAPLFVTDAPIKCQHCVESQATKRCSTCDRSYCAECSRVLHMSPGMKNHLMTPVLLSAHSELRVLSPARERAPMPILSPPRGSVPDRTLQPVTPAKASEATALCLNCEASQATRFCINCRISLCGTCDAIIHAKALKHHTREGIALQSSPIQVQSNYEVPAKPQFSPNKQQSSELLIAGELSTTTSPEKAQRTVHVIDELVVVRSQEASPEPASTQQSTEVVAQQTVETERHPAIAARMREIRSAVFRREWIGVSGDVCATCNERRGSFFCVDCDELSCKDCCRQNHASEAEEAHAVFYGGTRSPEKEANLCAHCNREFSDHLCRVCDSTYCGACYKDTHAGKMRFHAGYDIAASANRAAILKLQRMVRGWRARAQLRIERHREEQAVQADCYIDTRMSEERKASAGEKKFFFDGKEECGACSRPALFSCLECKAAY
jgi:hypothetical protein